MGVRSQEFQNKAGQGQNLFGQKQGPGLRMIWPGKTKTQLEWNQIAFSGSHALEGS